MYSPGVWLLGLFLPAVFIDSSGNAHMNLSLSEEALRCADLCFSRLHGYLLSSSQVLFDFISIKCNGANSLLLSWAVRIALNLHTGNLDQIFLFRINSVLNLISLIRSSMLSIHIFFILWTTLFKYCLRNYKKAKYNILNVYLTIVTLKGLK